MSGIDNMALSLSTSPSGDTTLPSVMYSWRVKALRSWMGEFKADGERQLMVSDLESLGHLDQ